MYMENTAKNFALQVGALVSMYVSVIALISLIFGIITIHYPDSAQGYWEYESATSSIRFGIAMLVVFFPTYLTLTRIVNRVRRTEQGMYLTLTKWLIYISLLIGGGIILGDLVATILAFLNGELTIRFFLKALTFLLVVGVAFVYYLLDARGYWQTREKQSIQCGVVTLVVVIVAVVFGFFKIEAPTEVREMRIDEKQIQELSNIQYHIETFYMQHEVLPESINEAFNGVAVPVASEGRIEYEYTVIDAKNYQLCAEFAFETKPGTGYAERPYYDVSMIKGGGTWEHGAGEWCYERVAPKIEPVTN